MRMLHIAIIIVLSLCLLFFSNLMLFSLVHLEVLTQKSLWFDLVSALIAGITLGGIPIVVSVYFLKLSLPEIGVRLPENAKQSSLYTLFVVIIFLPAIIFFSGQSAFVSYYSTQLSLLPFLISAIASAVYYLSEEFFFHGFLLFYIKKYIGLHTVWLTSVLFAFLHLGKPFSEVIFAFFLGVSLSLLSLKTKSFLPAAVVHFVLASMLIILIHV